MGHPVTSRLKILPRSCGVCVLRKRYAINMNNYELSKMGKSLVNVSARPSLVKGERWVRSAETPVWAHTLP